ncbi:MAG: hypothetical protein GX847_04400 [Clostridiales bacterium]|nr:hypothetical protein [Clostridiales bacterium]
MRKSAVAMPVFALVAGAFGFLIRRIEVNTAFEIATGFAKRDAWSTPVLIALSGFVIILAVLFALLTVTKFKAENDFSKAFAPRGFLYIGAMFILALGWLVTDVFYFLEKRTDLTAIDIIWIFLAAVTALSLIFLARGAYKGRGGGEMHLFSIIPPIFFCYWLIILYKDNAANPVLLSYCYQCLAIAAAALSFYFSAGFVYKKSVTGRSLASFLVTIYFCAVVLAENTVLPLKIFYGITLLVQFINVIVFIRNLKRIKA